MCQPGRIMMTTGLVQSSSQSAMLPSGHCTTRKVPSLVRAADGFNHKRHRTMGRVGQFMPKPGVVLSLCMCWGPTGCCWPCLRREHEAGSTVGRCSYKVCYSICNTPSSMEAAFCTCFVPWWERFARLPHRFPAGTVIHYDAGAVHSAPLPRVCMLIGNSEAWIYKHEHVAARHGYFMISSMIRLASSCYQQTWSWFLWRFGFQPQWGQCSTHKPSLSLHYPGLVFALRRCKDVLVSGKLSSNTSCNLCDLEVPYSWRSHRWCAHSCEFMCEAERMLIGGAKRRSWAFAVPIRWSHVVEFTWRCMKKRSMLQTIHSCVHSKSIQLDPNGHWIGWNKSADVQLRSDV